MTPRMTSILGGFTVTCVLGFVACNGSTAIVDGGTSTDASPSTDATALDSATSDAGSRTDGAPSDAAPNDAAVLETGDSGGGACDGGACSAGLMCCGGEACKNLMNDPRNCGACGKNCGPTEPMCQNGTCRPATCQPACGASQSCCEVNRGGPSGGPSCFDGITCPVGCPLCR